MSLDQIIILGVLTTLIFILTIFSFSAIYEQIQDSIELGLKDEEIRAKFGQNKKKSKLSALFNVVSILFLLVVATLGASAFVYQATGNQLTINNKVVMVVATDSMTSFYSKDYEEQLLENKSDAANQQFAVGDITVFELVDSDEELIPYEVYGYKTTTKDNRGNEHEIIIIHRYLGCTTDGSYIFRGDNTKSRDNLVTRDQIVYHYTEAKVDYVGNFVLFFKSVIGMGTILSVCFLYIIAEYYSKKYQQALNARYEKLSETQEEVQEEIKEDELAYTTTTLDTISSSTVVTDLGSIENVDFSNINYIEEEKKEVAFGVEAGRKVLLFENKEKNLPTVNAIAEFDRCDGTHVIIYPKGSGKKCVAQKALEN